jgi:chaperonin cofactor prefoldin
MVEVNQQDSQLQFLLSDISTRIRDLEERNNSMKERVLMLGQNLITTKETIEERVVMIEKQNSQINLELKKLKSEIESLSSEISNFTRKDEIILVERMLKDFQPLDFARRKDVEEMIAELEKKLSPANLHLKVEAEREEIEPKEEVKKSVARPDKYKN